MQRSIFFMTALAVLAASIAFAQVPGNSQPDAPSTKQGRQHIASSPLEKLAQVFDLTDSQKETARTIFEQVEQVPRLERARTRVKFKNLPKNRDASFDNFWRIGRWRGRSFIEC